MAFRKRGRNQKQGEYMKKLLFIAVVAAVVLVPATVFADVPSGDGSKGVFGGEINDYMNVNKFGGVEFTKNFGFIRAGSRDPAATITGGSTTGLELGLATRLNGGLYLGFNFDGTLWNGTNEQKKEGGKQVDPTGKAIDFDGAFSFLVGNDAFGGIKLSLDFDKFSSDIDKDEKTNPAQATEITKSSGIIGIGLGWGKNFAVGSGTLMPHISASFDIDTTETKTVTDKTKIENRQPSYIGLSLGAGYGFGATSGGNEVWADYSIKLAAYPDPISETPDVTKTTQLGSDVKNTLEIGSWNGYALNDRWTVAWVATLGLGLDSKVEKVKTVTPAETKEEKPKTTTVFSVTPGAAAGIKYDFATKPFTLKAGVGSGINFTGTKIVQEAESADAKTEDDTFAWTALAPSLAIGGVLTPTENFYIDMELVSAIPNSFQWALDLTRPTINFLVCIKK
jgi:hypothetical protein